MRYSSFGITVSAIVLGSAMFLYCGQVSATPIDITNWGFETEATSASGSAGDPTTVNGTTDGAFEFGIVPGWTVGTAVTYGVHNPDSNIYSSGKPNQGEMMVFIDAGSISQTLSSTLQANTKYTLDVDLGRRKDGNGLNAQWKVQLLAGSTVIAEDSITSPDTIGFSQDSWRTLELTYTSGAIVTSGQALTIVLDAIGSEYRTSNFDNVRLDASAIPEPTSLVMTVIGLVGLLAYAWRKRK